LHPLKQKGGKGRGKETEEYLEGLEFVVTVVSSSSNSEIVVVAAAAAAKAHCVAGLL